MKKFIALLLALVMALSLVACGSAPADDGEGVPADHRSHMGSAGGLHDGHVEAFLGEVALMDGHVQRQIADQVHRFGDGQGKQGGVFLRKAAGDAEKEREGQAQQTIQWTHLLNDLPGRPAAQQQLFQQDDACIHGDAHDGQHHHAHPHQRQVKDGPGVHNHTPQTSV